MVRTAWTRRRMVQTGAGVVALRAVSGVMGAAAQGTPVAAPVAQGVQPDGTWAFTDDRGITVTLPAAPTRIISSIEAGSALKDYGVEVLGVVGTIVDGAGTRLPEAGDLDEMTLTYLGEWDTFDIEAALDLDAEMYIDVTYWPEEPGALYTISDETVAILEQQIATLAIATGGGVSVEEPLARFRELAAALGADVDAPAVTDAVAAFEAATGRAREVFAEKADVVAAFVWVGPDELVLWDPNEFADTIYYQSLGLNALQITPNSGYAETLSLEQAQKYAFDALFHLLPEGSEPSSGLDAYTTVTSLPSVQAGQVYRWQRNYAPSYKQFVPIFDAFVADMGKARKVTYVLR